MIYIVLVIAALTMVIVNVFFRNRSRQTTLFSCVVITYAFVITGFLFYLCKDAFHLNLFLEFFPLPRQIIPYIFSMGISRTTAIALVNFGCTLFLMCNVLFAISFFPGIPARLKRWIVALCTAHFLFQLVMFNPYVYKGIYSALYPALFSSMEVEGFFLGYSNFSNGINCALLVACAGLMVLATIQAPRIQILRFSMLSVATSYTLVICSYILFFNHLPGHLVKYSKAADIFSYRSLTSGGQMDMYGFFPYLLLVFFLLFSASVFYLSLTKHKMDNHNLEITRDIQAANMSSRLFCHYMKNEILAISAEVECLPVTEETQEPVQGIIDRCNAIYNKLDGIHKSIRDNTMSMRQVPVDEPVRSALRYVEESNRLNGARVSLSCCKEIPYVLVDPVYFEQALIEIFYNAGDAMLQTEKKELAVTINYGMRWVTVEIADTGCGIEKKNMQNIFTPLFSTHAMTKNWGIGLSMTHRIITAFEGRIDVRSQPGVGTSFEILLPAMKENSLGKSERKENGTH